jgi:hypothetical protein
MIRTEWPWVIDTAAVTKNSAKADIVQQRYAVGSKGRRSAFGSDCYELLEVEIMFQVMERFVINPPRSV